MSISITVYFEMTDKLNNMNEFLIQGKNNFIRIFISIISPHSGQLLGEISYIFLMNMIILIHSELVFGEFPHRRWGKED
jgi:hypothetical protein